MNPWTRRACALTAPLLTALAIAPVAGAAPAAVQTGALDWTMANVYESSAPQNTNRTWLGYTTSPPPLAAGSAVASAGAVGEAVTTTSARGADKLYTFGYPATGGSFDAAIQTGTVELDGAVTFASQMHGFTISVEDPQLVLSGATGQLFGSGKNTGGSYDRSGGAVFDLDLSAAQVSDAADGTRTIAGIVPRIATEGLVFPSGSRGYAAGSGPDRTPNTFGAFTLRVKVEPAAAAPAPAPIAGTVRGPRAAKTVRVTLASRLTTGGKAVAIRLLRKGKVVATGTAAQRRLTLKPRRAGGKFVAIKGTYTVKGKNLAAKRITVR
jgi:hypothetical protein